MKMKTPILALFFLSMVGVKAEDLRVHAAYDSYLRGLGYEDYPEQIRKFLASGVVVTKETRESLEANATRYGVVNSARELALKVAVALENSADRTDRKTFIENVIELTARALGLQPLDPDTEFPPSVENRPEHERGAARRDHLVRLMRTEIILQTEAMTSNFITTLTGPEPLKKLLDAAMKKPELDAAELATANEYLEINQMMKQLVRFMWLDSTLGQTRYLGRALALVLARYDYFHREEKVFNRLRVVARDHDVDIANFVGATLRIPNERGEILEHGLRTGDRVFERTREAEAAQITSAAIPHWARVPYAYSRGLIGNLGAMLWPLGDEPAPKALSILQMIRLKLSATRFNTLGVSHIGTAWVPKDAETGIQTTWVIDNYPGGIRQIGIMDAFAEPGVFMKIGFARDDPHELWKLAHEQIEARKKFDPDGYVEALWESDQSFLDSNGRIRAGSQKDVKWPTFISRVDFKALHSIPLARAPEWYKKVMALTVAHIRRYNMLEQGTRFSFGFDDKHEELYCASTYCVAMMQAAGIDPQRKPDQFHPVIRVLTRLSQMRAFKNVGFLADVRGINLDQRIVAPSGLAAADTVKEPTVIRFPTMTQSEQFRSLTRPPLNPMSDKVAYLWGQGFGILTRRLGQSGNLDVDDLGADTDELMGMIVRAMEGNSAKRAKSREARLASGNHGGRLRSVLDRCVSALEQIALR